MNYRIETTTQHGKEISTFYALPQFTNQEKVILDTIGKAWFADKQGTGIQVDYRCKFTSKYEIYIYKLAWETVEPIYALDWANELYKELKADLDKTIEQIYILPFAVKCLLDDNFIECKFNENFIKIPAITSLRKMMDQNNQILDALIKPTVKDMNNIQVKLRDDVIELQSNLSKVAANLDYLLRNLQETEIHIYERMDEDKKGQETLNWDFTTRLNGYDDWVEKTLKPLLAKYGTSYLVEKSFEIRIEELEKQILILQTPWYKKLWNKLTIFWSNM